MERVAIFVDGSNFYHGLKEEFEIKDENAANVPAIDFQKFTSFLCGGRKLINTYYYNAPLNQSDKDKESYKAQQRFFNSLKFVPDLVFVKGRLEKRTLRIAQKGIGKLFARENVTFYVEKGVDVNIAVDMLKLAFRSEYDTAILVSGDGDFAIMGAFLRSDKIADQNVKISRIFRRIRELVELYYGELVIKIEEIEKKLKGEKNMDLHN